MRIRDQIGAKKGLNEGLTNTPTPTFCSSSSKTKNKKLPYKPNSFSYESRLHLAIYNKHFKPLDSPKWTSEVSRRFAEDIPTKSQKENKIDRKKNKNRKTRTKHKRHKKIRWGEMYTK